MQIIAENDSSITIRFENETGTGNIRAYEVFPGILLSYSNFQLEQCESNYAQNGDMFGFEYCLEGKIEWEKQDGNSAFLGAGSFMPYRYERNSGRFQFPQHHYRGFSFGIQLPKAAEHLPQNFPVDLVKLKEQLHTGDDLDLSGNARAAYILGLVEEAQRQEDIHRKLACLELLLFLQDLKWTEHQANPLYMPRVQVQKMKQIAQLLLNNMDRNYTLQEISASFQIPVTTLRRSFEGIYGCSVAEFVRKHRVEEAQRLLRETDLNTSQIAAMLGYDNPSKFAAVFRAATKLAPQMYRRKALEQNGAF